MRVAVVTNMWPYPARPAFGVFVADQVRSLRRIPALDVEVFVLEPSDRRLRYLNARPVARRIRQGGFDVVHAHHPFSLAALAPFVRRLDEPVVLTIHGIEGSEGWRRWVTSAVVPLADGIVVTTERLRRRYGGWSIPCGVDGERFHPGPPPPLPPVRVLTVGEDRPEKQFWLASDAVCWARSQDPSASLDHRFVSGVSPEDMPEVYRSGHVLLLSSRAEGSPMVVQEALASGLRVVTTDVGDLRARHSEVGGVHVAEDQTDAALGAALLEAARQVERAVPFVPAIIRSEDTAAGLFALYEGLGSQVPVRP